jgi:hypothetical protein
MTCVNRVRSRLNIGKDTETTTVPVVWEDASKILKTEETRRECNEVTYVNWIPSRHKHIHVCAPLTINLHKFLNERFSPQWYTFLEQNKTEQTHGIVCSRIRCPIYVVKLPRGSEVKNEMCFYHLQTICVLIQTDRCFLHIPLMSPWMLSIRKFPL